MAAHGRPALRDLFDESPTPHIAHPHGPTIVIFYVATDGSFRDSGGGLGAVIETRDGTRVARVATADTPPDNNVAEYRALHLGLDVLAAKSAARRRRRRPHRSRRARQQRQQRHPCDSPSRRKSPRPVTVPTATQYHWRGIRARLSRFDEVRAARIDSDQNPAHPSRTRRSNTITSTGARPLCPPETPEATATEFPPPSRADRNGGSGGSGGGRASD